MIVLNDLLNYNGLKIYQDTDSFCFSLDSVLLANFVTINKTSKKIIDLGCGNAAIPLFLSTRTDASITGIEIQKSIYDLAVKSVKYNKLESKIDIINDDINNLKAKFSSSSFDVVVSNPPYFKVSERSLVNESPTKIIARHEVKITFDKLVEITNYLLKEHGVFAFVHRPERLFEFLEILKKYKFEPKKIQFIYPNKNKECNMILVECVKNGKNGLKILPPLFVHNKNDYSEEVKEIFNGRK